MADSLGGPQRTEKMTKYEKYIPGPSKSRADETMRADNKRIDEGRGSEMKSPPTGRAGKQRWKASGR